MKILVGKKSIVEFSTCLVDPGNARWHTAHKKDRGNLEATWLLIVVIIWILSNVYHFHNQWPIWSSKVLWACTRWTSALLRSLGERAPGRLAHRDVHSHLRDNQDQLEDFFKWCYSIRCKVSRDQVHLLQDRLLHIAHHCCSHQDGFYVWQQPGGRKYDFVDLVLFLSGVKWNQGFNDHWFYSLIISDLRNCSLEGGYEVPGSVLQPELFADKNATSLQSIIFRWEYYQDEYFSLRARPVLHTRHSLCLGLCVVESHAVPCRGEFCWLFVCFGVEKVEKLLTNHDHVRISESKSSLTPCRKALIEWSVFHHLCFLIIPIIGDTFPPGRKSGCLHTPRVCSPRTVEGGTSNRPLCPWPNNLFRARGSVKVQNRNRVSVTFENICKRAQCFFPRPFGSAAPRLSFTNKKIVTIRLIFVKE